MFVRGRRTRGQVILVSKFFFQRRFSIDVTKYLLLERFAIVGTSVAFNKKLTNICP